MAANSTEVKDIASMYGKLVLFGWWNGRLVESGVDGVESRLCGLWPMGMPELMAEEM